MKLSEPFAVEELRKHFVYDPETGNVCWVGTGKHRPAGAVCGSINKDGYRAVYFQRRHILCHRLAWALHCGHWPTSEIDHINRDRTDNRIANLRIATSSQNAANRMSKSTHGYRGIALLPSGRYQAQAKIGGVSKYLGTFATKEEAHAAYMRHVVPQRGEFLPKEIQP